MADARLLRLILRDAGLELGDVADRDRVEAKCGAGFEDALAVLTQEGYIEWNLTADSIRLSRRGSYRPSSLRPSGAAFLRIVTSLR